MNNASWLGARKKSDMMVLLEREDGRYTAGETVRGRVHIILTQDISIKGPYMTSCVCSACRVGHGSGPSAGRSGRVTGQT